MEKEEKYNNNSIENKQSKETNTQEKEARKKMDRYP